jgi:hypothetical protein
VELVRGFVQPAALAGQTRVENVADLDADLTDDCV